MNFSDTHTYKKYPTEEAYEKAGMVAFMYHDSEFGDVKIYAYKRWRANGEFKRLIKRIRIQREKQRTDNNEALRIINEYRKKVLEEKRDIEDCLGITPIEKQTLFDKCPEQAGDSLVNISLIAKKKKSTARKKRKKDYSSQMNIDFDGHFEE